MKNNNLLIYTIVFTLSFAASIIYVSTQYIALKNQELKNEAITSCMATSNYEFNDLKKGIRTSAPQKEYYKICLTDKGYSTIWD